MSRQREEKGRLEDLSSERAEELTPEQAEEAKGGIIAIMIGMYRSGGIKDGTSNTLMVGERLPDGEATGGG